MNVNPKSNNQPIPDVNKSPLTSYLSSAASYGMSFFKNLYESNQYEDEEYVYGDGAVYGPCEPVVEKENIGLKAKVSKVAEDIKIKATETKEAVKEYINAPRTEKVIADPKLRSLIVELARIAFPDAGQLLNAESILEKGWNFFSWVFEPTLGASNVRNGVKFGGSKEFLNSGLGTGFVQDQIKAKSGEVLNKLSTEEPLRRYIPFNLIKATPARRSHYIIEMINTVIHKVIQAVVYVFRVIVSFFRAVAIKLRLINGPKPLSQAYLNMEAEKKKLEEKFNADAKIMQKIYDLYTAKECLTIRHEVLFSNLKVSAQEKQEQDKLKLEIKELQTQIETLETSDEFAKNDEIKSLIKDEFSTVAKNIALNLPKVSKDFTKKERVESFKTSFLKHVNQMTDQMKRAQLDRSNKLTIIYHEDILKEINRVEVDKIWKEHDLRLNEVMKLPRSNLKEGLVKLNARLKNDVELINKSTKEATKDMIEALDVETTNYCIRLHTDNMKATLAVAGLSARLGKKVSEIFSSAGIDHSLKFLREQVLGGKNQAKMKALIEKVQDRVVINLASTLNSVNNIYSNLTSILLANDSKKLEEEVLKQLALDSKLHSAILYVSPYEKELVAKRDEFVKLTAKIESLKKEEVILVANGNQTKLESCRADIIATNAKLELNCLKADELQTVQIVEKRIANCESDYLKKLSNELLDYVLFPNGIPTNFKYLLWFAGLTVDSQCKDARVYIFNKIYNGLKALVSDNIDNPQKLQSFCDELISGGKLEEWQTYLIPAGTFKNRINLTQVNKHIIFTALDEAIKVLKE